MPDVTTRVRCQDAFAFLARRSPEDGLFDLIFADPPYALDRGVVSTVLRAVCEPLWLRTGGIVVVERTAREPEPLWPDIITPMQNRRYGESMLWYGRRN